MSAQQAIHDSLQEWNTDEFVELGWNNKAAAAALKALGEAGYVVFDVTGLSDIEIEDIRAHIRAKQPGPATYPRPDRGWTCFHCGETFHTPGGAALHFGKPVDRPVCHTDRQTEQNMSGEVK